MPIPEELAFLVARFRKVFGSTVTDTYTLNRVYVMAVTEMYRHYGYEEAARRLFEWGYVMGHSYMLRLEKDLARFNMDAPTIKLIGRMAWYMFAGNDPETLIETREEEEGTVFILRVRDPNSPWDAGLKLGKKVAHYPAGAYEAAGNTFAEIVTGGKWRTFTRNTKSVAAGDPYTELVHIMVPTSMPKERVFELFPEHFEEISYDFSDQLYKRFFKHE